MGRIMVVSKASMLDECIKIADEFDVAFEINDFFEPDILDNQEKIEQIIDTYKKSKIPEGSTLHGAFYDVAVFSRDAKIREVSFLRMRQSMEIAGRLNVAAVVFHTNYNPGLSSEGYKRDFVKDTAAAIRELLLEYPEVDIYLENMFDTTPEIVTGVAEMLSEYPNFGLCLDWAHANVYGNDLRRWTGEVSRYVKHMHINDNDLQEDLHKAVGSGSIDWNYFEECYKKYFGKCSILVETNDPKSQRESIKFLKEVLLIGG